VKRKVGASGSCINRKWSSNTVAKTEQGIGGLCNGERWIEAHSVVNTNAELSTVSSDATPVHSNARKPQSYHYNFMVYDVSTMIVKL